MADLPAKQEEYENLRREVTKAQAELDSIRAECKELDEVMQTKRAIIDDDLDAYKKSVRQRVVQELEDTLKETKQATDKLATLDAELTVRQRQVEAAGQQRADEQHSVEEAQRDRSRLQAEISDLTVERDERRRERDLANYQLNHIQEEVMKAQAEHERLLRYEKVAWAKLKTKDEELQQREANIASEEAALRNRRSFLPKMD